MSVEEVRVPDLEGASDVAIVEVYVSSGESVEMETPLISLESDKAVMDVPSPLEGAITELKVNEGDTVNEGDLIALIETAGAETEQPPAAVPEPEAPPARETPRPTSAPSPAAQPVPEAAPVNTQAPGSAVHATPSVRTLARELGVDLARVAASGPKGRVTREDVTGLVKSVISGGTPAAGGAFSLPPIPGADYAAFGEITTRELGRIKKISGPHLHRNWLGVPHITQFDEADITALEDFRKELNAERTKRGETKISPLVLVIKAVERTLKDFPDFNSSLATDGANLILKFYINIGIAVDTPGGLVVPVIKDVPSKGIYEITEELASLSMRAREGKLKGDEMKGATFSISSLGGIGGTAFTPIVNVPEVAILGLSKSSMKPVWNGTEFVPGLMLPLSLSYDHRVIDGARGARFIVHLSSVLKDLRRTLL